MTDTTTLSGAEFRRHVGTDPAKWAEAFVRAGDRDGCHEMLRDERAAYATQWFRDAMEAAVAEAVRHETAAITGSQQQPSQ